MNERSTRCTIASEGKRTREVDPSPESLWLSLHLREKAMNQEEAQVDLEGNPVPLFFFAILITS